MASDWNFPGSKWWKFDFHTHTPASDDYGRRDTSVKNITPENWLRKAMESGLDCVAVTDHNSGGWIDTLKEANRNLQKAVAKPKWYRKLVLFPGVEITVADSRSRVHLLALFDPDCDSQKITGVLGACGITAGHGDDQSTSTTTGFVDTVKKIIEAGGIALPAHIDGAKGLLEKDKIKSLTVELKKSLKNVFAAEFCDLHSFDNAYPGLKEAMSHLASVAGSDAHNPEDIGRYFSWIKMSQPSIRSLQLALRDYEFCVTNQSENPNCLPDIFLSKLTIASMRHCGRVSGHPFTLQFHPHLNTFIGGRGTGKSTVLESIRIVSRREQSLAIEAPRVKDELDKFMRLSQEKGVMLKDTEILLELWRHGKNYRLCWRFDQQGPVLEKKDTDDWQEVETGNSNDRFCDFNDRFPISIFSQKQINELASNPRGILEVIDRVPEVNRTEWKLRWETAKSQFLQLKERERELARQVDGERQLRMKLEDVENDLKLYEEKRHGEILKEYQKCSQQKNSLPDDQIFDTLSSAVRELSCSIGLSDFPAHLFDECDETTAGIKAIHEQTAQGFMKISKELASIADRVDTLKKQRKKSIFSSQWYQKVQQSIATYDKIVKEYKEKKSQLNIQSYGELVQNRDKLQQQLNNIQYIRKESELVKNKLQESLTKLRELRTELFKKRKSFLEKVIGGNEFVRMKLVQYGDVSTLEDEYRSFLNIEEGTFTSSIYDPENRQGILWKLNTWEDEQVSESTLHDLVEEIKSKTFAIAQGKQSGSHGKFDNRLKKLFEVQPALFDQLDAWWPEDLLRVQYSKEPSSGKFDDLDKGSAGQKAAAILAFLLSYGSEPLIIDQPEDDLDNSLIYNLIVKQIHKNKKRRQLVIVTHNPNIVVNGDSELTHVLKFENGQIYIDQQGGIEEPDIINSICTIMEGGKDAFDKRYTRIRSIL